MVHFVGAGPGAPDLITRRGAALLQTADCIIYAGSLVNPALLGLAKADCAIYNSAEMTLEQVLAVMRDNRNSAQNHGAPAHGRPLPVRAPSGSRWTHWTPTGIPYDDTPGVSSFCGAAAALNAEYTLARRQPDRHHHPDGGPHPGARRASGWPRWPPMGPLWSFSSPSVWWTKSRPRFCRVRTRHRPPPPSVYKATWPEQKIVHCTVGTLGRRAPARPALPKPRSSSWGTSWPRSTIAASFTTPLLPPSSAGETPQ